VRFRGVIPTWVFDKAPHSEKPGNKGWRRAKNLEFDNDYVIDAEFGG
jgi:hypothetical protein